MGDLKDQCKNFLVGQMKLVERKGGENHLLEVVHLTALNVAEISHEAFTNRKMTK